MSTQYTPDRKTIGDLLSVTNPPILVPDWQRNYSWTSSEVETFWNDLRNFDNKYPNDNINGKEYFLGSVVIVDNNQEHLLLDGQQRLATSAILLSVIRDFLKEFNENAAQRVTNKYLIDFDDAAQKNTYKLTMNRYDRDYFKREILEAHGVDYKEIQPAIESHQLIRKAREYFQQRFTEKSREINNPKEFHFWALRILKVLTGHVSVVAIITDDEDNASTVFETLNDRGIGLSTPDLLRNLIIRRGPDEQQEEIINLWGEVLETEGDVKLKTFIRHYWISHEGDVKTQSLYREIKEKIVAHNISSLSFSRDLRDASIIYREIIAAQDDDENISMLLHDINDINASTLYPAILSAYQVANRENLGKFIKSLIVTYIRHTVIGRLENSILETQIYSLAKNIRLGMELQAAIQHLADFAPKDKIFIANFNTASIPERNVARYLLKEIERELRITEELEIASPTKVHVEHIYPQTPRPDDRLSNHVNLINRLGNLTLLSRRINTSIKNGSFSEKKPHYLQSEILLTKDLATYENWSEETINSRQEIISRYATKIWAYPEI